MGMVLGQSLRTRFLIGLTALATWILLGLGFRFYAEHFGNYNKTYGAVGGVAILLLLF